MSNAGLYMYNIVVKNLAFGISSPDDFLVDRAD